MMLMRFVCRCALAIAIVHACPAIAQKKDHEHGKELHFKVTPPPTSKPHGR